MNTSRRWRKRQIIRSYEWWERECLRRKADSFPKSFRDGKAWPGPLPALTYATRDPGCGQFGRGALSEQYCRGMHKLWSCLLTLRTRSSDDVLEEGVLRSDKSSSTARHGCSTCPPWSGGNRVLRFHPCQRLIGRGMTAMAKTLPPQPYHVSAAFVLSNNHSQHFSRLLMSRT